LEIIQINTDFPKIVLKRTAGRHIEWELFKSFEFYTLFSLKLGLYDAKKDEILLFQAIKVSKKL
jgi:hypothetical protein